MLEPQFIINAGIALAIVLAFVVYRRVMARKMDDLDRRTIELIRRMRDDELERKIAVTDDEETLAMLLAEARRRGLTIGQRQEG